MTDMTFLAESAIEVGEHKHATWLGLTVNTDTILSTGIAALIVLALAFFLRAKITSTGVPSGVQLFWEAITVQMRETRAKLLYAGSRSPARIRRWARPTSWMISFSQSSLAW